MIYGVGIDLVEVERIEKIMARWGDSFTSRVYSDSENEYCGRHIHPVQHYAVRFAAKEAFLKSLGLGMGRGICLKHIEIVVDVLGRPIMNLNNSTREVLAKIGATNVHVSLTHTKKYASAVIVIEQ
ncbi:MAG: holo-ACP synthase [Syntrophales bacterium]|jgi:holo-[acyl-carrier protein] synthase|nr:holo-ACP synthase [Syntrophales bacterium]MDY0044836.1 holo-ACP synthase [Syntrophales bacterium]